jgi:2-polyprenyl-3-methyl-5-hydroxy-6-metoxy-1,4-benzoquinol methylase
MNEWKSAQAWEKSWWSNCSNTVWEDVKQMGLVPLIGLKVVPNEYTSYRIPLNGQTILDIGGGPSSILLKCENFKGKVVDPCNYPNWIKVRYKECGIDYEQMKGEDIPKDWKFDICLIYNVLQHTDKPKKIIENALAVSKEVRLFEWIETGVNVGHIHNLTEKQLNKWLGGEGKVVNMNQPGLYGKAFVGIFKGKHYDS